MKNSVVVRPLLILALSIGSAACLFSVFSAIVGTPLASNLASTPVPLPAKPKLLAKPESARSIWQQFTTLRGNFSVLMPGAPQETLKAGISGFEVNRPQDTVIYSVSYIDFPSDPKGRQGGMEEVFSGTQAGFEENQHILVDSRPINLHGNPGREMKFTRADGLTTHCRLYVVDQRLYLVMARTTREKYLAKSIEGFLNSFQIAAR